MSNPSLKDLTSLGVFSGRISEVHMKNLENFPFIFFNFIKEVSIDYNVELKDKAIIQYDLTLDGQGGQMEHIQERCKGLESAVRSLFWKELTVVVSIHKQEVYRSV